MFNPCSSLYNGCWCLYSCQVMTFSNSGLIFPSGDINFDLIGYGFIFINNVSTAAKGLLTKSRLSKHNFSSITLLFYNSIFMFPFMLVLTLVTGRVRNVCRLYILPLISYWLDRLMICVIGLIGYWLPSMV